MNNSLQIAVRWIPKTFHKFPFDLMR